MLIPYSTDAPVYHFPWSTIVLILANTAIFVLTGRGSDDSGWYLTYGQGLRPIEWVAYCFLHFGYIQLILNMFFLWSFGIVVEGKLGWWKFLLVYMGIGITGGFLLQTAMLGYIPELEPAVVDTSPVWVGNSLWAQEKVFSGDKSKDDGRRAAPDNAEKDIALPDIIDPLKDFVINEQDQSQASKFQSNVSGASLIIYGLMAIVLVWAPRNDVHFMWIGYNTAAFEVEYLYFCGFYIVFEIVLACLSLRGFEMSSELGHLLGAAMGFGVGTLFVKRRWVDCERWDLYSLMRGKHEKFNPLGDWKLFYNVNPAERRDSITQLGEIPADESPASERKTKKKKSKPKLAELASMDDALDASAVKESGQSSAGEFVIPSGRSLESDADWLQGLRQQLAEGDFGSAFLDLKERKTVDSSFRLPQDDLRQLSNGLYKAKAASDAAELLKEYVARFPNDADCQRVKLSVLFVKYLGKPGAALKLLGAVDAKSLPEDYRAVHRQVEQASQKMLADGADAID